MDSQPGFLLNGIIPLAEVNLGNEVVAAEEFVEQGPEQVEIFLADLGEYRSLPASADVQSRAQGGHSAPASG